ncbi:uncharacterized protein BROUX77_000691 [Berkeleyomyces rouxiae]|uniref:uncharacterized protein n=1 Tax=Berkeleyomyces rouxiae TaxID=2035830 RepID=UPI003B762CD9
MPYRRAQFNKHTIRSLADTQVRIITTFQEPVRPTINIRPPNSTASEIYMASSSSPKSFHDRLAPFLKRSRRRLPKRRCRMTAKPCRKDKKTTFLQVQTWSAAERYRAPRRKDPLAKDPLFMR